MACGFEHEFRTKEKILRKLRLTKKVASADAYHTASASELVGGADVQHQPAFRYLYID